MGALYGSLIWTVISPSRPLWIGSCCSGSPASLSVTSPPTQAPLTRNKTDWTQDSSNAEQVLHSWATVQPLPTPQHISTLLLQIQIFKGKVESGSKLVHHYYTQGFQITLGKLLANTHGHLFNLFKSKPIKDYLQQTLPTTLQISWACCNMLWKGHTSVMKHMLSR